VTKTNASIQINKTTVPGGFKVATYQYVDGGGNTVESEAVTLTDSDGNELLGQQLSIESVPVVIASDQSPVPVVGAPANLTNGHETAVPGPAAVQILAANAIRAWAIMQNTGTANIRVGVDNTVTATTGLRLLPNATITSNEFGNWTGDFWAIPEGVDGSIAFAMEATFP
jgi:hypothetical protein